MKPINLFIGWDPAEAVAYHTMCHSILTRASVPVSITPIVLSQTPLTRARDPKQSNEFAFSRWLVPYMSDYAGYSIFMDCDMLVLDDIAELIDLVNAEDAVNVVKHTHQVREGLKYLGTPQTPYERKNWSSVMVFNNAACRVLTPEYVNTAQGLDLHQFRWLRPEQTIGELPLRWNFLVDYYVSLPVGDVSNLHFTEGGPYFKDYAGCTYAQEWNNEYGRMIHCTQKESE